MKTTSLMGSVDPSSRLVRRLVGAAATGLLIVFFWGALALTAIALALTPCRAEGSGCLGQSLLLGAVAAVAAVVVAWPMLYLLWVRPAWPVALTAPITVGGLAWLLSDGLGHRLRLLPLVASLSYGVAALATDVKVSWPWRVGMVVLVVANYPLTPLLRDQRTDAGLQRYYARAGAQLMAPNLDDYMIADPSPMSPIMSSSTSCGTERCGAPPPASRSLVTLAWWFGACLLGLLHRGVARSPTGTSPSEPASR